MYRTDLVLCLRYQETSTVIECMLPELCVPLCARKIQCAPCLRCARRCSVFHVFHVPGNTVCSVSFGCQEIQSAPCPPHNGWVEANTCKACVALSRRASAWPSLCPGCLRSCLSLSMKAAGVQQLKSVPRLVFYPQSRNK